MVSLTIPPVMAADQRAAARAFKKLRGELLYAIQDIPSLTNELYSKGVISRVLFDRITTFPGLTRTEKCVTLLNAIESGLGAKSSNLWIVVATFEATLHIPLMLLAARLKSSFGK